MSEAEPTAAEENDAAGENDAEQPEEFLNRAARRAKGKKHGPAGSVGQASSQPHGRATVQVKRSQFGNRRTGG